MHILEIALETPDRAAAFAEWLAGRITPASGRVE